MTIKAGLVTSLYSHDISFVLFLWIVKHDYKKTDLVTGAWTVYTCLCVPKNFIGFIRKGRYLFHFSHVFLQWTLTFLSMDTSIIANTFSCASNDFGTEW